MQSIVNPENRVDQPVRRRGFFGWCTRLIVWALVGAYFVVGLTIVGLRYWLLPNVPEYRDAIANLVSERVGQKVTIGRIEARWQNLHPYLELGDVQIHDRDGQAALRLPSVAATIAWQSLFVWDVRFHSLVVNRPRLEVRRDAAGRLFVAGIELGGAGGEPGLADWILRQRELMISGGEIEWTDERRRAPALILRSVELRLVNQLGNRHRVALSAVPPAELASKLDVRADLTGRSLTDFAHWRGEIYAHFDYTDLAGWSRWVDYPLRVARGRGGLRMWLGFEDSKITKATADLALADVAARLRADLPELKLKLVRGRLGAREARQGRGFLRFFDATPSIGYRVFGAGVELVLAQGKPLAPLDFSLAWDAGAEPAQAKGEFTASALELAPLAEVAESLPFPKEARAFLATADPRGRLSDIGLAWTGPIDALRTWSGRGRFAGLALNGADRRPGFAGLSGSFEATQKGGAIQVHGEKVELAYAAVFHSAPKLVFDSLEANIGWAWTGRDDARVLEVRLPSVRAANAEIEASVSGTWRSQPGSPGVIDITASFPRVDVKSIPRYIPFIDGRPAQWLRSSLVGGKASEGELKLRGDLHDFPFETRAVGTFEVRTRFTDGVLRFADDWPAVENITGEYAINGVSMTINAQRGTMTGIPVSATRAHIANFFSEDPMLVVEGNAEGRTTDFLRFIAASPVHGFIDGATDRLAADGGGRLALRLDLPLARMRESRVSGQYTLLGNELRFAADQPPLANVSGRIDFSGSGIEARNLTAQFLGGPATLNVASRADGLVITGQGTAALEAIRRAYDPPFASHAQGAMPYRATVAIGGDGLHVSVESPLTGVEIGLPPPFGKSAAEPLPLALERVITSGRDTLSLTLGRLVSAQARYRSEAGRSVLERMGVAVGETVASLPERAGIAVAVNLKQLDYDRLAPVLPKPEGAAAKSEATVNVNALSIQVAEMIAFGRRLNAVNLRANLQGDAWVGSVAAREAEGDVSWWPDGRGRLTAKLKHFTLPEAALPVPGTVDTPMRELPGVDIVAERFRAGANELGRLELRAANEAATWKIETLTMTTPEGAIRAHGTWQPGAGGPASDRTEVSVEVDVADAGKYLARFGQPNTVRTGKAQLAGNFGWNGAPSAIDYPSLSGKLDFKAGSGQFLRVDPGIGRLLGVLSLQSLPRRISLDFRDVFSDGFAFDDIAASVTVEKGVMRTDDFRMAGPAAAVVIKGEADLARESQNLHVKVVPVIGDSIAAVAGLALLNPVVGIGTLIAQRLLKDPLGQIFAYEYQVTGAWSDPKVERLSRLKPAATPDGG